jgi:hemin uptake protein HemP
MAAKETNRQDAALQRRGEAGVRSAESAPMASIPKVVAFNDLARCGNEIWIENDGQLYRLRRTRQGKLILTK